MSSQPKLEATRLDAAQWHDVMRRFEDATIYQTVAFGSVCWKEKQLHHLVLRDASGEALAATQVRLMTVPLLNRGIAYVRWGPLFRRRGQEADPECFRQALVALKKEYAERRQLMLRIQPHVFSNDPWYETIRSILESEGFVHRPALPMYRTLRVDLSANLEAVRKGMHQRWRNKLKRAEGEGTTATLSDSVEAYRRFLGAYDEMMARKRFDTTVDVREFERVQERLPAEARLRTLICEKDGVLQNALVVAPAGDGAIYLLAATSNAGLEGNGAFLLQWRALDYLKTHGFRWYDMGGINPETNPGVYQFKSGVGGIDCRHLGGFEFEGARLSSWIVRTGENWKAARARAKAAREAKAAGPAETTPTPAEPASTTPGSPSPTPAEPSTTAPTAAAPTPPPPTGRTLTSVAS